MTNEEANLIIAKINAGGSFSTRFQEESWGFYRKDEVVIYWTECMNAAGSDKSKFEDWTFEKLKTFLMNTYSFKIIDEKIQFEK